jgi:hypothetical protein
MKCERVEQHSVNAADATHKLSAIAQTLTQTHLDAMKSNARLIEIKQ